jgi:N6-adenosine-specific RNA methylase IME4
MNRELALGRLSITAFGFSLITVLAWSEHMSLGAYVAVALFYCLALNIGISLSIRKRNKEEAK